MGEGREVAAGDKGQNAEERDGLAPPLALRLPREGGKAGSSALSSLCHARTERLVMVVEAADEEETTDSTSPAASIRDMLGDW